MDNLKIPFLVLPDAPPGILQTGPGSARVPPTPASESTQRELRTPQCGTHHSVKFYRTQTPRHLIKLLRRHGEKVVCGLKSRRVTKMGRKEKEILTPRLGKQVTGGSGPQPGPLSQTGQPD